MIRVLLLALALWPASAAAETDGRALFHGHTPFAAGRAATPQRLPAERAACAACHGPLGEGSAEGGVSAPPLRWQALISPRGGQPGLADEAAVAHAITDGQGRAGDTHPAMPRYRISAAERDALIAYLHVVGTAADLPPGVQSGTVAIGAILPLSGPAAPVGEAVLAGLHDVLDAAAPVYGRRLQLRAEDAVSHGAAAAAEALVSQPVYAVVAGLWRAGERDADPVLAAHRVTSVASLVVRREPAGGDSWSADLLPPLSEQDAALSAWLVTCDPALARVALGPSGRVGQDTAGITWQRTLPSPTTTPGCVGAGLGMLEPAQLLARSGWNVRVVLPMPAGLGGGDIWRQFGRASARMLLELLARSGALLHERSLLAQLPGLSGFEPLPGLPVRFSRQRRFAWDPALTALEAEQ